MSVDVLSNINQLKWTGNTQVMSVDVLSNINQIKWTGNTPRECWRVGKWLLHNLGVQTFKLHNYLHQCVRLDEITHGVKDFTLQRVDPVTSQSKYNIIGLPTTSAVVDQGREEGGAGMYLSESRYYLPDWPLVNCSCLSVWVHSGNPYEATVHPEWEEPASG